MKKSKLTLTIFLFLIISNLHATVYYVDVNGNDSNNGTSTSTPWKTIGKVNSMTFSPGDQILFMRGQTFVGSLWPKGSGSAGAPITLGDYGSGNRPIIQGPTTAPNYVSNGGFESGTTGWLGSVSTSGNGYFSANSGLISSVGSGAYQTITGLTPNTTYTLNGHLSLSNGTDVARLYAKNYGGPEVGNNVSNNGYSVSALTFTTGPSSTSAEIGVWKMSGSANVYLDDITVTARNYAIKLENQQYWIINNIETVGGSPFGICVLNSVANSDLNFIRITNCAAHDVAGTSDGEKREGCIVVYTSATGARFNDVIIDGCTAYNTQRWMGITVFGDFSENRRSTNIIVRNSTVYNIYGDGILEACVVNATIENCVSHDVGNMPQNRMGTPNGIWHYFTNNGAVRNCEAYNTHSPGADGGAFDIDLLCTDVTVEYNYGHDNDGYGVAMFAAYHDIFSRGTTINSIVRYNIFYNNGRASAPDGCDQGDIWVFSYGNGNFDGVQIYNNTMIWNPVQSYAAFRANSASYVGTGPRIFKNNIIISNQRLLTNVSPGLSLDNNLYYFINSTQSNPPYWNYNNTSYTSLSAYKNGTGQEANSVYADPLFMTGSSKLQAGSAATNAGAAITNPGTRDFYSISIPQGGVYDIGAGESYNLARNTGFDKGDLSSWTLWTSGGNGGVSATKRSGSNSGWAGGGLAYLGQTISGLLPNTSYTFSAYIRNDTYSSPASNVWAGVKNMGTPEVSVTVGNTSGQWVPVTVNFTTGTNSTSADIYLWTTNSNTTGYIDDVKVTTSALANASTNKTVEGKSTIKEPEANKSTISVFPNPATSVVTINSKTNSNVNITIFDFNGKIVGRRSLQGRSLSINVSKLPKGMYIVKTESVDEISSHPLIIQ